MCGGEVAGVFAMGIFDVGVFDAGVFEIAAGVRPLVRLDVVLAEVVTESTDDFFERPLPRGQIPFLAFSWPMTYSSKWVTISRGVGTSLKSDCGVVRRFFS